MAWWIWLIIILGIAAFIPIKIFCTKKFLSKMNKEKKEDMLDE
jgi:hypothetical protein